MCSTCGNDFICYTQASPVENLHTVDLEAAMVLSI